jgi:hypothetical protein
LYAGVVVRGNQIYTICTPGAHPSERLRRCTFDVRLDSESGRRLRPRREPLCARLSYGDISISFLYKISPYACCKRISPFQGVSWRMQHQPTGPTQIDQIVLTVAVPHKHRDPLHHIMLVQRQIPRNRTRHNGRRRKGCSVIVICPIPSITSRSSDALGHWELERTPEGWMLIHSSRKGRKSV